MQEYLVILLAISVIITSVFRLVKHRIPLNPRVAYTAVGISFALGAVFPFIISNASPVGSLAIYFILVVFSATVLSHIESRAALKASGSPAEIAATELSDQSQTAPPSFIEEVSAVPPPFDEVDLKESLQPENGEGPSIPSAEEYMPVADSSSGEEHRTYDAFQIADYPFSLNDAACAEEGQADFESGHLPVGLLEETAAGKDGIEQEGYSIEKESLDEEEMPVHDGTAETGEPALPAEEQEQELYAGPVAEEESLQHSLSLAGESEEEQTGLSEIELPVEESGPTLPETPVTTAGEDLVEPAQYGDKEECKTIGVDTQAVPACINDFITEGFKAKAAGRHTDVLHYFFKALAACRDGKVSAALALEISAAFQEFGQHEQAAMFLSSFAQQECVQKDPLLLQQIRYRFFYLETLAELLKNAKMANAPNSKIPNLIKIKANMVAAERLK